MQRGCAAAPPAPAGLRSARHSIAPLLPPAFFFAGFSSLLPSFFLTHLIFSYLTKAGSQEGDGGGTPQRKCYGGPGPTCRLAEDPKQQQERSAVHSSPNLTVFCFNLWLHTDNLRLQVLRHPCDLILDDKLVYVFVAKRKLELWKH